MKIIRCEQSRHADAILEILNEAIVNSTALFDYQPRTAAMMTDWFDAKDRGGYPVIGIESDEGELIGFGSYGTFRAWPAYQYSVEHSLYVKDGFRGRRLGKILLREIIAAVAGQNYHVLIGGIEATNAISIALHERMGFSHCGTIAHAGYKFGRWLDLAFYQLILPTPTDLTED